MMTDQKSINVGETERLLSMFGAGVFTTCGLLRGSLTFMALGAGLAYRGYTGHCYAYEALSQNTAELGQGQSLSQKQSNGKDSRENSTEPSRVILSE